MWTYGPGFPFAKKVSFTAKDKPLETALDELLSQAGDGLGYVVVAKDGDKYDGWVRLTTTGERGMESPPPTAAEEKTAAERLALAKKLIDAGKPVRQAIAGVLVKKYPPRRPGWKRRTLREAQQVSHSLPSRDVPWIPPELADPDGFVGLGGDLAPRTLLRAYAEGVFPWFNDDDPILWWSPDPRAVIELHTQPDSPHGGLHVSRRLARTIRSGKFRVTINRCFEAVMLACGENREGGTWVTPDMLAAYIEMHRLGHAHSVETWVGDTLAGGVYGLAVGGLFAAESMFYRVPDGSKVALVALVSRLRERGFTLLDVQMTTPHTERMGAINVPRSDYLRRLREALKVTGARFE